MPQIVARGPAGPPVHYWFDQAEITIGRAAPSDLVVGDVSVSRLHVAIRREGESWMVEDQGSTNGTQLNGSPLVGRMPLVPGDEIAVGETVIVFDGPVIGAVPEGPAGETTPLSWSSRGRGAGALDGEAILVGRSAAIRKVLETIEQVARSTSTVLITGESGTGKELVARLIHQRSPRQSGPYVTVNCPALPGTLLEAELFGVERGVATGVEPRRGLLESAKGGTVLLDEVGDLEAAAQAKLLRVLQEKTFARVGGRKELALDVRFLAATNHDLPVDVARGTFRLDLYHRLNFLRVVLPPLRDRREDIPLLVEHFLGRVAPRAPGMSMSAEALAVLAAYDFPGNVRELAYFVERASLMGKGAVIGPDDLPEDVGIAKREGEAGESSRAPDDASEDGLEERLYDRIVHGGESFWGAVHEPYMRRQLSRESVRRLVERVYQAAGNSYKEMARLLRLDDAGYRKLLSFLNHHDLTVKRAE